MCLRGPREKQNNLNTSFVLTPFKTLNPRVGPLKQDQINPPDATGVKIPSVLQNMELTAHFPHNKTEKPFLFRPFAHSLRSVSDWSLFGTIVLVVNELFRLVCCSSTLEVSLGIKELEPCLISRFLVQRKIEMSFRSLHICFTLNQVMLQLEHVLH